MLQVCGQGDPTAVLAAKEAIDATSKVNLRNPSHRQVRVSTFAPVNEGTKNQKLKTLLPVAPRIRHTPLHFI